MRDVYAEARQQAAKRERLKRAAVRLLEAIDGSVGGGPWRHEERADEAVDALADIVGELQNDE